MSRSFRKNTLDVTPTSSPDNTHTVEMLNNTVSSSSSNVPPPASTSQQPTSPRKSDEYKDNSEKYLTGTNGFVQSYTLALTHAEKIVPAAAKHAIIKDIISKSFDARFDNVIKASFDKIINGDSHVNKIELYESLNDWKFPELKTKSESESELELETESKYPFVNIIFYKDPMFKNLIESVRLYVMAVLDEDLPCYNSSVPGRCVGSNIIIADDHLFESARLHSTKAAVQLTKNLLMKNMFKDSDKNIVFYNLTKKMFISTAMHLYYGIDMDIDMDASLIFFDCAGKLGDSMSYYIIACHYMKYGGNELAHTYLVLASETTEKLVTISSLTGQLRAQIELIFFEENGKIVLKNNDKRINKLMSSIPEKYKYKLNNLLNYNDNDDLEILIEKCIKKIDVDIEGNFFKKILSNISKEKLFENKQLNVMDIIAINNFIIYMTKYNNEIFKNSSLLLTNITQSFRTFLRTNRVTNNKYTNLRNDGNEHSSSEITEINANIELQKKLNKESLIHKVITLINKDDNIKSKCSFFNDLNTVLSRIATFDKKEKSGFFGLGNKTVEYGYSDGILVSTSVEKIVFDLSDIMQMFLAVSYENELYNKIINKLLPLLDASFHRGITCGYQYIKEKIEYVKAVTEQKDIIRINELIDMIKNDKESILSKLNNNTVKTLITSYIELKIPDKKKEDAQAPEKKKEEVLSQIAPEKKKEEKKGFFSAFF
jgi:hypothetical protein